MADTEAPTSSATVDALADAVAAPVGLSSDEAEFVILNLQYFGVHGTVIPYVKARTDYGFDHDEFIALATNPAIQSALQEQGISTNDFRSLSDSGAVGKLKREAKAAPKPDAPLPAWQDTTLTPLQLIVANTMLDLIDNRSAKKKLQDLGVSTKLYNNWLKDPTFQGYLRGKAESMLGENQHEAHLVLLDKMRSGDTKALSMYYEMTGMFVPERGTNAGTAQVQDFQRLLVDILEIIQEECEPEAVRRISDRLKALIGMQNTATALVQTVAHDDPIVVPSVEPARELSPRIRDLMDHGVGADD